MYGIYSSTQAGSSPSPRPASSSARALKVNGSGSAGMDADDDADYIFEVQGNCDGSLLAASLSSRSVAVHNAETLQHVATLQGLHSDRINGMEFMRANPSVLVTSSDDHSVHVWDVRVSTSGTFGTSSTGTNIGSARPALSIQASGEVLDVSVGPNDAMLACAVGNGVSFFDIRGPGAGGSPGASLGEYADVNTDDVTQLRFHPTRSAELVTAGDDGLVCVFNTAVGSGEEAVTSVFNTDCPVQRFGFFGHNLEGLYCVSSIETLSVWHAPSAQRIGTFPDARDTLGVDYLVDCCYSAESDILTLLGGCHSATIRSALCTSRDAAGVHTFVTGGEDSTLCAWRRGVGVGEGGAQQTQLPRPGYGKDKKKEERRSGSGKASKKESRRYSPY